MTADPLLLVAHDRGVATVTVNRPAALNAMTPQMQRDYGRTLVELGGDPQVRVIVVTGAGRGFCSGADIDSITLREGESTTPFTVMQPEELATIALELPKPVVAAVQGVAAGMGFSMMLACDIRFVAPDVKLMPMFSRLGLIAEFGTSWTLSRAVGTARAMELLMSSRTVFAEEALATGIGHEIVADRPVLDRALEWAHDVADHCSPRALAKIKSQVYDDFPGPHRAAVERSMRLMAESMTWGELQEALRARKEGRDPAFAPVDGNLGAEFGEGRAASV